MKGKEIGRGKISQLNYNISNLINIYMKRACYFYRYLCVYLNILVNKKINL